MRRSLAQRVAITALGWGVALLLFFPILWMVLTSFKSEVAAIATPPQVLFTPTLESYVEVQERANYVRFALNSLVISVGGTVLALAFAIPAAYSMAFHPTARTRGCRRCAGSSPACRRRSSSPPSSTRCATRARPTPPRWRRPASRCARGASTA